MDEFSHLGYVIWFGLIEIIAKENKNNLTGKVSISPTYLGRKFRTSPTKVRQVLDFCRTNDRLLFNTDGKKWEIDFPKILEIKDNYIKDLQVSCKKLSIDIDIEKDIEKDIENTSSVEVEKKRSTSTAMKWPENGDVISKNLKDFLLKQSYFKDDYQSQLMHYEWWDNLSTIINGIDIKWLDVEFAKMRKWIIDNPKRSPTIRGFRKFVGSWLERGYEKERKFKT